MPVLTTYPGVYIEEVPSGVRTIMGVRTSVAAFIDYFKYGPMNKAVKILSMGDFERVFGGLNSKSEASYAIQQFFLNGGTEAWVVRTASGNVAKAKVQILSSIEGEPAFSIEAINEGEWGNNLYVRIDYNTPDQATLFNMRISENISSGGKERPGRSEIFRNLSMNSSLPSYVKTVVNDENSGSKLVRVDVSDLKAKKEKTDSKSVRNDVGNLNAKRGKTGTKLIKVEGVGNTLPLQNGTVSEDLSKFPMITSASPALNVTIGSEGPFCATFQKKPDNLAEARSILEKAIRSSKPDNPAFASTIVEISQNRLHILAGPTSAANVVTFAGTENDSSTVSELKLDTAISNVREYKLGDIAAIPNTAQGPGVVGANGDPPNGVALMGDLASKTGIYALENADQFNILCIPRTAMVSGSNALSPTEANSVISVAKIYCEIRRAFFIIDTPNSINETEGIKKWLEDNSTLRSKNSALYFPRVKVADPLNEFRLRSLGACGTIAGLYARTDGNRGIWKAPAGTEATLVNVQELDYSLTDEQNGTLNPLAINCLRNFAVYGNVCWGGRTLEGADQTASEWKYIPVRRLALYIEESLYRGTHWVVFEPNDEPLWAQIRLNINAFMHSLFRQGALQGKTPREAYFVKCDRETTIQDDINRGLVNIMVGFAPLKPAEFVVIKIQQIAGQIQT